MSALPERIGGNWSAFFCIWLVGIRLSSVLPLLGIAAVLLLWWLAIAEVLHPESILV